MNNREIKFRIWHAPSKNFVFYKDEYFLDMDGKLWYIEDGECRSIKVSLKDYIIQQFTGLKDKNGKEIYEGDILSQAVFPKETDMTEIVIFEDGRFCIKTNYKNIFHRNNLDLDNQLVATFKFKIIGNIYENPNLIS